MGYGSEKIRGGAPEAAEITAKYIQAEKEVEIAEAEEAEQVETSEHLLNIEEEATNPLAGIYAQRQKTLKEQPLRPTKTLEEAKEVFRKILPDKDVKDQASRFEKRDPEFKAQVLLLLLEKIKDCKDKDELLKILNQFYPDPTLADQALDFLLLTTLGELREIVQQAKTELNQQQGREIQAGRNIANEVKRYVSLGLGAPSKLRDFYRDITGNPRDPVSLFLELGDRFTYKDVRKVLAYLFHALGADLKSQGPSISQGMLSRLLTEVRDLQAGLGIMQFFKTRMKLIEFLFGKNGISVPPELNFETLSRQFVTLLQERYPSAEKVIQLAQKLGILEDILAKIIVLSQMRDAVREVALNQLYRSLQHRDEIFKAILDALEQLEEELDELTEREEEEEEEGGKKKKGEEEEEEEKKDEQNEMKEENTSPEHEDAQENSQEDSQEDSQEEGVPS